MRRRRAGGRRARLRDGDDPAGRPHRRPGKRLRHRGQAARLEPGRDRSARRSERGGRDRRRDGRRRRPARRTCSPRPSTAPTARRCCSAPIRRCPPRSLRLVARYDNVTVETVGSLAEALARSEAFAPEHLELHVADPDALARRRAQRRLGVRRRLGRHRRLRRRRHARPADRWPRALLRRPRARDVHEAAAGRADDAGRRGRGGRRDRPDRAGRRPPAPCGRRRACALVRS